MANIGDGWHRLYDGQGYRVTPLAWLGRCRLVLALCLMISVPLLSSAAYPQIQPTPAETAALDDWYACLGSAVRMLDDGHTDALGLGTSVKLACHTKFRRFMEVEAAPVTEHMHVPLGPETPDQDQLESGVVMQAIVAVRGGNWRF